MVNCDTCNIINGINYFQIQIHRYDATKGLFYLIQKNVKQRKIRQNAHEIKRVFLTYAGCSRWLRR